MINKSFISIDCNNTGRIMESYLLRNDVIGLRAYSLRLNNIIGIVTAKLETLGGEIYLSGGDNVLALINDDYISEIDMFINEFSEPEICFSIGLGADAVSAYLALKYAKSVKARVPVAYENGEFILKE